MSAEQSAFQINVSDNVATALSVLAPGSVLLRGDVRDASITAAEDIPAGHKLALCELHEGEDIVKYGVVIGRATKTIALGSWVHLHCMRSVYDERSSHLDPVTGAPTDIKYE